MLLHLVSKSPWSYSALQDCLQVIGDGDALLLLEDGAYGVLHTGVLAGELVKLAVRKINVYVIETDLRSRGLVDSLPEGIEMIGYDEFVALATTHKATQSWY